jgi:P-type E1-E2 ATPase
MATGDNIHTVNAVGKAHSIDEVYPEFNPAEKILIVKELNAKGVTVAMTGERINDVPAFFSAQ